MRTVWDGAWHVLSSWSVCATLTLLERGWAKLVTDQEGGCIWDGGGTSLHVLLLLSSGGFLKTWAVGPVTLSHSMTVCCITASRPCACSVGIPGHAGTFMSLWIKAKGPMGSDYVLSSPWDNWCKKVLEYIHGLTQEGIAGPTWLLSLSSLIKPMMETFGVDPGSRFDSLQSWLMPWARHLTFLISASPLEKQKG
jgi:hypothetical protein